MKFEILVGQDQRLTRYALLSFKVVLNLEINIVLLIEEGNNVMEFVAAEEIEAEVTVTVPVPLTTKKL